MTPFRGMLAHPFETAYHPKQSEHGTAVSIEGFSLWYGNKQALFDINMIIQKGLVTAIIGPSGCGKSTLLRSLNRINDLIDDVRTKGRINFEGRNIYDRGVDVITLRRQMGMVFQKPNPFPKSIEENVCYPLRVNGIRDKGLLKQTVEKALKGAARGRRSTTGSRRTALRLSGGQQQRLCIARAIAGSPDVLLMDEPCSALDPLATARVEDLIDALRGQYTIIIVTHNMQQAARVSDNTAFMYMGRLVEYGDTETIFTRPRVKTTSEYVTGRFG